MSDPVAFVRARLAEEDVAAQAAFSSQADPENGWGMQPSSAYGVSPLSQRWTITPHVGGIHEEVQARHVATWHPGRALANIQAIRAALDFVESARHERGEHYVCPAATLVREGYELDREEYPSRDCNCGQTFRVRILAVTFAQPYADHPEFDPMWFQ